MILLLALTVGTNSQPPTAATAARFAHRSYLRAEREVSMRASGRYLLVRRGPQFATPRIEKVLAQLGADHGLVARFDLRDALSELDLGADSDVAALLRLGTALQDAAVIEQFFPVWTRPPDGRTHVDDRVVLRLQPGAAGRRAGQKYLAALGLTIVHRARFDHGVISARLAPGGDTIAVARWLQESGVFVWAEPDWIFHPEPLFDPADPLFERSWHQRGAGRGSLGTQTAWNTTKGSGVVVGVIDSGTQQDHPDLDVFSGFDVIDDDRDASPECIARPDGRGHSRQCPRERPYRESHGTAVSGLIAARSNELGGLGVCPECRLLTVRMVGVSQRRATHADALRWLIANNAGVVNNSWGPKIARYFPIALAEEDAITAAGLEGRGGKGLLLLYAAGNDSRRDAASNPYAAHPDTVTVSGSSRRDDFACYSNQGAVVDIAAPTKGCYDGEPGLITTDITGAEGYNNEGDYHNGMGGTSGACPVASGVAALIIGANPELTSRQVRLILQGSAEKIRADQNDWPRRVGADLEAIFAYDEYGHSLGFGYGRVHAGRAVMMAVGFLQGGPCVADCAACRDERCAIGCDSDLECPGMSRCVRDDDNIAACEVVAADPARVGAACSDACDTCLRVASQGGTFRNLCSASCADGSPCPGGWICAEFADEGRICVPGFEGCGGAFGAVYCSGEVRVLDSAQRAFCSCPCFLNEANGGGAYCPDGFHCGRAECRCTRERRGGCRELTCAETEGEPNYNPVCFPDQVADPPCSSDSDCGTARICVENECRDDPYWCPACAPCSRHSDCGEGNWCAPIGSRNVCLVACGAGGECPGNSICRAVAANGRSRSFCLNDPDLTRDDICPATYRCRSAEGRCRVAADCPTRDHWCDDDGECRLDDPDAPGGDAGTGAPPIDIHQNAPVAGCNCNAGPGFGSLWLALGLLWRRRRRLGAIAKAG